MRRARGATASGGAPIVRAMLMQPDRAAVAELIDALRSRREEIADCALTRIRGELPAYRDVDAR